MKQITLFRTKRKAMRANKKGGIEGLPLQLLIIIVVVDALTQRRSIEMTRRKRLLSRTAGTAAEGGKR